MDLGLKGRVAVVGGSSRGLGRAIAEAFAREGASVTISARTEADLRRTEIELARFSSQQHVLAIPADWSAPRDIRRVVRDTFNRFGQVGILVTYATYGPTPRPSEFSDEAIMTSLEEGLLSVMRITREVIPYMKQQRWGRIIHLMPTRGILSKEGAALYAVSQVALAAYSAMLAAELAPFNITVNNLLSGPVKTEFLTSVLEARAEAQHCTVEEIVEETISDIPMRRMGKPEEVGDLAAFIASDRAGYLTGASVVLDGGAHRSAGP